MARQRLPSLNARMRTRRSQLGLTGVELAQRAGISPSYVSLIERGAKVPDEDVAAGLARALDDDEDLYRAWARAARLGLHKLDLLNRFEVISRTPGYLSLVESGQALPKLEPPGGPSRAHPPAAGADADPAGPAITGIPAPAGGPARGRLAPSPLAIRDRLLVD